MTRVDYEPMSTEERLLQSLKDLQAGRLPTFSSDTRINIVEPGSGEVPYLFGVSGSYITASGADYPRLIDPQPSYTWTSTSAPSVPWDSPTTATPLKDLLEVKRLLTADSTFEKVE